MNAIHGTVKRISSLNGVSQVEVKTDLGDLYTVVLSAPHQAAFVEEGRRVECIVKESSIILMKEKTPCINTFVGVVKSVERGSVLSLVKLTCAGLELKVMLLTKQLDALGISEGEEVYVFVPPLQVALEAVHE